MWDGETAVLIGSGPSLEAADVNACAGRARVLVINDSWRAAPWADLLYACDGAWWDVHHGVPGFLGPKWTQDAGAAARWGLRFIASRSELGLSRDPSFIHQGQSSGYQALNIAALAGARRVLLLGYDYSTGHWFGKHPPQLSNSHFGSRADRFKAAAQDCEAMGVEVINCTPTSAITCFPRMPIRDALNVQ